MISITVTDTYTWDDLNAAIAASATHPITSILLPMNPITRVKVFPLFIPSSHAPLHRPSVWTLQAGGSDLDQTAETVPHFLLRYNWYLFMKIRDRTWRQACRDTREKVTSLAPKYDIYLLRVMDLTVCGIWKNNNNNNN